MLREVGVAHSARDARYDVMLLFRYARLCRDVRKKRPEDPELIAIWGTVGEEPACELFDGCKTVRFG